MDSRRYSHRNPKQSDRLHSYDSPSFSSTLLDSIYNSFDDNLPRSQSQSQSQSFLRRNPPLPKSNTYRKPNYSDNHPVTRRRSLPPESTTDYYSALRSSDHRRRSLGSATSGSGSSSSDADFFYRGSMKPIRTEAHPRPPNSSSSSSAKARAMKLYGDLKRMKQPISPGGKLASFINSLFSASKKQKTSEYSNFSNTTPSCLSKRPSSSSARYEKQSVRFCQVSAPPRGNNDVDEKNRRVEEMARNLMRNSIMVNNVDEEEDAESCCSSDLFELEIGVDRFCAELPVYETTRLETNRAIANAMLSY